MKDCSPSVFLAPWNKLKVIMVKWTVPLMDCTDWAQGHYWYRKAMLSQACHMHAGHDECEANILTTDPQRNMNTHKLWFMKQLGVLQLSKQAFIAAQTARAHSVKVLMNVPFVISSSTQNPVREVSSWLSKHLLLICYHYEILIPKNRPTSK